MALFEDTYDALKIEKLKQSLQKQSDLGRPQYFEIYVDGLKAVPKTNDINEFDNFENFMLEDTEKIRILVYTTSAISPRNDQFTYRLKKQKEEVAPVQPVTAPLNGLDIEARIDEKMRQQRQQWEHEQLKDKLKQTEKQLKEAEDYAEKLEVEITDLRSKKTHFGNINLGELASVALEGIVRRNPQMLAKIPGGETLAGIIEADNKEKQNLLSQTSEPEPEITFKKQSDTPVQEAAVLSEEEKGYIAFMRSLAESFEEEEITLLTHIIQKLEEDTSQLKPVAELLNVRVEEVLKK